MKTLKSQGGFSFIEALVTVGIMGVMASMALPQFTNKAEEVKFGEHTRLLEGFYTDRGTEYQLDGAPAVLAAADRPTYWGNHVVLVMDASIEDTVAPGEYLYGFSVREPDGTTKWNGTTVVDAERFILRGIPNDAKGRIVWHGSWRGLWLTYHITCTCRWGGVMKGQGGFTIIEVMVTVGLIALLSVLAIPTYNDYTARVRIVEPISLASAGKTSILEWYATTGSMPAAGSATVTELQATVGQSDVVGSTSYGVSGNTGTLTITFANLGTGLDNTTMEVAYVGGANGLTVTCNGGTLPTNSRPAACK